MVEENQSDEYQKCTSLHPMEPAGAQNNLGVDKDFEIRMIFFPPFRNDMVLNDSQTKN